MNAVGIDVSKGKSMIAILRPYGEIVSSPFEIHHTSGEIRSLIEQIKSIEGESRIVMEHTGRYYEPLAHELSHANLFISAMKNNFIGILNQTYLGVNTYFDSPAHDDGSQKWCKRRKYNFSKLKAEEIYGLFISSFHGMSWYRR